MTSCLPSLTLLQKLLEATKEAKESSEMTQKGLDAATKSADNAISGICSAIVTIMSNGWGKRKRHLTTITGSRKRFGRSIANDLLKL